MMSESYVITSTIVVIVVTFSIEEVISLIIRRAARVANVRPAFVRDITVGLRIVAALIVISTLLGLTGLSSEFTSLTISGIAALAVTLALQSSLSNVIANIILLREKAIRVDDTIQVSGIKGRIVRIALINTWIKLDSGEIAVVSNSNLLSGPFINFTATDRLTKNFALT